METNDYKFQKLTPINDANLSIYKNALDFVFANDDIKNIGVSGAYSSGKSSIIESYKQTCPEKHFLHISLAYFEPVDSVDTIEKNLDEKNKNEKSQKENLLEGKILNQLIHQINPNSIPQTNFKVKHMVSKSKTIKSAFGIVLFCCALAYILGYSSWKKYSNDLSDSWFKDVFLWVINSSWLLSLSFIVILGSSTYLAYKLLWLQKNKSLFKKVKVQGNEIEIFEQSDDSYFDKYLNEVLYLFDNSNADVVVFEDMDRFNINQIFQRLREINTVINTQRKKRKQSPIRFLYLLRDDIFISKDRTKFFDFIIPIVPVLDSSNSYDQFIAHLKEGDMIKLFDKEFLQGISLYIDDMRILKNIYNEFIIYNSRINTTEQDYNKLLALIVYKNLFPRDFSDLQLNKGFIYTIFLKKNEFILHERRVIEEEIEDFKSKIQAANDEILSSENELNIVYSHNMPSYGILRDKLAQERDSRIKVVKERENGSIEKYKLEIDDLERKHQILQNKKLCEIINRSNIETIFKIEYSNEIGQINNFNEIKGSEYFDLLKYLIRHGFIDESYQDYMTYFYENSLSAVDKVFLRSVTDEKAKDYTFPLKNPKMVALRLSVVDFDHEETLNFDLFTFLLQEQPEYQEQLKRLILQLKAKKNLNFIEQFFATENEIRLFIYYANHYWTELFKSIVNESNFSDSKKRQYAKLSIYYSSNEDLKLINAENFLSDFISNRQDFLQISTPDTSRIIEVLNLLEIKFTYIDYEMSNLTLWSEIYSRNLYKLNVKMIETILENQYHINKNEDYIHKNFSLVLSQSGEPLEAYVKDNMEQYMEVMLKNCKNCIYDNEEAIAFILNNDIVSDKNKKNYIDCLKTTITSLRTISEQQWWQPIIENNILLYSLDNVLYYFFSCDKTFDNVLVTFINEYGKDLNFKYDIIQKDFGQTSGSDFFNAVVKCNSIEDSKYKSILKSLSRIYKSFSIKGINDDKIDILTDLNIITMNTDTLIFIRENYKNNILHFIEINIEKYLDVIKNNNFLFEEVVNLLNANVKDKYKIRLLGFIDEPISIVDKKYTAAVETYILENNYDIQDTSYILEHYDTMCKSSKVTVEKIAIRYKSYIISNQLAVPYTLFIKIISDQQLQTSDILQMFILVLPACSIDQCKECLEKLQLNDYLSLFDGRRPKFLVNNINASILSIFKGKGWINFDVDSDEPNYYRAIGRKSSTYKKLATELL